MSNTNLRFKCSEVDLGNGDIELVYLDTNGNSHVDFYSLSTAKKLVERLSTAIKKFEDFQR